MISPDVGGRGAHGAHIMQLVYHIGKNLYLLHLMLKNIGICVVHKGNQQRRHYVAYRQYTFRCSLLNYRVYIFLLNIEIYLLLVLITVCT
jgi:hypothetical protein